VAFLIFISSLIYDVIMPAIGIFLSVVVFLDLAFIIKEAAGENQL